MRSTRRRCAPTLRPAIERLEALALLSGLNASWFAARLRDPAIRGLAVADWAAHRRTLTRSGVIGLFRAAAGDGVVSGTELADLRAIATAPPALKLADPVRGLANRALDASAPGDGRALDELVDKWFLGLDRPDFDADSRPVTYARFDGPLFGPDGRPHAADVAQGVIGDCYFLSALGITAEKAPQRIRQMIADNGDDTFTVRFFRGLTPTYVTVDRLLPIDAGGRLRAAKAVGPLWVALVEKAYAQLAGEGWSRLDASSFNPSWSTNSYAALEQGYTTTALAQITGLPAAFTTVAPDASPAQRTGLIRAIRTRQLVACSTAGRSAIAPGLIGDHAYMVTGYDPGSQTFRVVNPHGAPADSPADRWQVSMTWAEFAANFSGYDQVLASPAGVQVARTRRPS